MKKGFAIGMMWLGCSSIVITSIICTGEYIISPLWIAAGISFLLEI